MATILGYYQQPLLGQIYAIAKPLYFTTQSSIAWTTLVRATQNDRHPTSFLSKKLETLYTINRPKKGRLFQRMGWRS
jgi:hypothetical protein